MWIDEDVLEIIFKSVFVGAIIFIVVIIGFLIRG